MKDGKNHGVATCFFLALDSLKRKEDNPMQSLVSFLNEANR